MSDNVVPFPIAPGVLETPEEIRAYVSAGRARITLESHVTGRSLKFRIKRGSDRKLYAYEMIQWGDELLGELTDAGVRITRNSQSRSDSRAVRGLSYVWRHVVAGRVPPHVTVLHGGRCGACGRGLTDPTSIRGGIGPECRKRAALRCA